MRYSLLFLTALLLTGIAHAADLVAIQRLPDGELQPQIAIDSQNTLHMVYFKGEALGGDLYYTKSVDNGVTFSKPMRVNSQDKSAVATGTIRGAQIAIGRNDRAHVAWNGSHVTSPDPASKPGAQRTPMLYARMNDGKTGFEPQRNVIHENFGIDGGGSIAADDNGNVYVAWHAPLAGTLGEENRKIWIARSTDDGQTFAPEFSAWDNPTGVCGCCGMKIFASTNGKIYLLYRAASQKINRDEYLLIADKTGEPFKGSKVGELKTDICIMSSADIVQGPINVLAAWEQEPKQVAMDILPPGGGAGKIVAAPSSGNNRKYPVVAQNKDGLILLAWTEDTSWDKGGSVHWQVFDKNGKAMNEKQTSDSAPGLPAWSFPAVFAKPDGTFVILY